MTPRAPVFLATFAAFLSAAEARPGGVCSDGGKGGGGPAPAMEIAVAAFDEGLSDDARAGAWLADRFADLVAEDLLLLGLEVRDRRLVSGGRWTADRVRAAGLGLVAGGRVTPATPSGAEKIAVELAVMGADKELARASFSGSADEIDRIAADAAAKVAEAAGARPSAGALSRLSARRRPFLLQRALGEARAELLHGDPRKARIKLDRASELVSHGVVPEALEGAQIAQALLAGRARQAEQADLATSALERAETAFKAKNKKEAIQGFVSFVRYTRDNGLHWSLRAPLDPDRAHVIAGDERWLVSSLGRLWSIDPVAGAVSGPEADLPGLIGAVGDQRIAAFSGQLERKGASGPARWKLKLPFAPQLFLPGGAVAIAGGLAPIAGARGVAWVDLGIGALTQTAEGVEPRAQGDDGVVITSGAEVALLRPGKKTPAWKTPLSGPATGVEMSPGRVVVIIQSALFVLDAQTGKQRAGPIQLGPKPRWLGAGARYGAIAHEDGAIWILDVLGGERTAIVKGPSRAVAALGTSAGVVIAFQSGDVLGFDREGQLLERTRVDGVPFAMLRGSELAPGPVVLSTRGLWAFGEAPEANVVRDVDAMLRLGEALAELGEPAVALELVERALVRNLGRVGPLETLRARLLDRMKDTAGAAEARARAAAAKDPLKPLARFRL